MIISHSRKFIFIHVHKAGGSSIESAIAPYLAWNDLILGTTPLGEAMNAAFHDRYGINDHSSVDEIAATCGAKLFNAYFSFALVRHPVSRAVSLYNFLHSLCQYHFNETGDNMAGLRRLLLDAPEDDPARLKLLKRRPYLTWHAMRGFLKSRSFSEFIRSPLTRADVAFFPQSERVCSLDGGLKVDQCIKLEELNVHLPRLSKRLGFPVEARRENASEFRILEDDDISLDDRNYLKLEFDQDFFAFEYT